LQNFEKNNQIQELNRLFIQRNLVLKISENKKWNSNNGLLNNFFTFAKTETFLYKKPLFHNILSFFLKFCKNKFWKYNKKNGKSVTFLKIYK